MHYIKDIEVDTLKIDKSFVLNCDTQKKDLAITRAMISIAKNLEIEVVAEGVENQAIFDLLSTEHCEYLQGYFISKPKELPLFIEYINSDYQQAITGENTNRDKK
jgi:EAL domain-containing protein (putative c-di-GMP-specific phosphodiesterase class I)